RATGARQLNYLGYSYGTYLGAVYAKLFPGPDGANPGCRGTGLISRGLRPYLVEEPEPARA
ncbi:hypothetical protein, partial [Streptomyces sp. NPDC019224]|uniref:hypothetical protein n=1 Tax=Streptomyces sp. NPDC019224 TaxID=3154484 RepID=UPI0033E261A9